MSLEKSAPKPSSKTAQKLDTGASTSPLADERKHELLEKAERLAGHPIESEPVWLTRCEGCGWETLHIGMGYRVIRGAGKKGQETRIAAVPCHCGGTLVLVECVYRPTKEGDDEDAA